MASTTDPPQSRTRLPDSTSISPPRESDLLRARKAGCRARFACLSGRDPTGEAATGRDGSRKTGDDLELLLLAVAEVVPDDDRSTRRRSAELCASYDRRMSTEAPEAAAGGSPMDAARGT